MKIITNSLKTITLLTSILFLFSSCENIKNNGNAEENDSLSEENISNIEKESPVICLWSAVSLRETPTSKGKWITTIYLGEKGTYFGEKSTDSTDANKPIDYIKIKLIDGKEGWIAARFMAINAKSYVFEENSALYKRPDILSESKNEFKRMQYVVSLEEKEDWIKVKGIDASINWYREGWVKKNILTDDEIDIATAILTTKAITEKENNKKLEALNEILENTNLSSSQFLDDVDELIENLSYEETDTTEIYYE